MKYLTGLLSSFIATCAAYLLAFTVVLPLMILLKLNKKVHRSLFAKAYSIFIHPVLVAHYIPKRKWIFDRLKEHGNIRKKSGYLEMLEIGAGPGTNFQFYPENCNLTVLDKNEGFVKYLDENKKRYPHVNYKRTVIGCAEDMNDIDDASMDVVVGTYVLCSVDDVPKALKEIHRVLKPGGIYVFVEHVAFRNSPLRLSVQRFMQPIWRFCGCNCHIARTHLKEISKIGFSEVIFDYKCFHGTVLFIQPHEMGLAVK